MPIRQDIRNNVVVADLNGKPKRNKYSLKKLLDRSRFSPRLLRLVKPCKSFHSDKTVSPDANAGTCQLPIVQQCVEDNHGEQFEAPEKITVIEEPAAVENGEIGRCEEEYEESLAHFTDRILCSVRPAMRASQPPLYDDGLGSNPVDRTPELTASGGNTARLNATTPPVNYVSQVGGGRGSNRYELADTVLSQPLPNFSIYNEPCDAKPDSSLSGLPVPVYSSTGEVKLTNGDQINLISPSYGLTNRRSIRSPLPALPSEGQVLRESFAPPNPTQLSSPMSHTAAQQSSSPITTSPNSLVASQGSGSCDLPSGGGKMLAEPSPNPSRSSSSTSPLSSPSSAKLNTAPSSDSSTAFIDLPRGNTVIVHHASSPFARVPRSSGGAESADGGGDRFGAASGLQVVRENIAPSPPVQLTEHETRGAKSLEPQFLNAVRSGLSQLRLGSNNGGHCQAVSTHHTRLEPTPTYEEAWDIKMTRQLGFGIDQLATCKRPASPTVISPSSHQTSTSTTTPTTTTTTTVATSNSSTTTASPPPPPPHNSGVHQVGSQHGCPSLGHKAHGSQQQQQQYPPDSNQNQVVRRAGGSGLRFYENKLFEKGKPDRSNLVTLPEVSPSGEYDYAYNESWSIGVQRNLDLSLSQGDQAGGPATVDLPRSSQLAPAVDSSACPPPPHQHQHSQSSWQGHHRSERRTGRTYCASPPPPRTESHTSSPGSSGGGTRCPTDTDFYTHSTDSCDDTSWEAKHGRCVSELTGVRVQQSSPLPPTQSDREAVRSPRHPLSSSIVASPSAISQVSSTCSEIHPPGAAGIPANPVRRRTAGYLPLEEQPWFHPFLTRAEAEELLHNEPDGSFLVRTSETCPNDYSLSIKHKTYLHMKISRKSTGHFILGEYSQPYTCVPQMIRHYAYTQVPVRGGESVMLMHPVGRRTLDSVGLAT